MADRPTAGRLLARALELYDAPGSPLAAGARRAARRGFSSGAAWMAVALAELRGEAASPADLGASYQFLGLAKYGLAGGAALGWASVALLLHAPLPALLAIPLFYAVEAQFVFLFPLALDG